MGSILIIDDEDKLRGLLARVLSLEGYKVLQAATGGAGLKLLEREEIHVVISDVKLGDTNGIDLANKIKNQYPPIEVILMTAYGTIPDSVSAMKKGVFDYITKGEGEEQIIPAVARAMEKALLQFKVIQLEKKISSGYSFDSIIGRSEAIQKVVALARKVAVTDTTALLLGETGTGKEVFAQAIHKESNRKNKSFVAINCSAIPRDLLESEMFGYKAGAFTGAVKDKKGLFEEADGGSIFLDEIGEMNLDLQAKLLRVLENHTFIKQGDTRETKVNVRVIAATHKDLKAAIEKKEFREDLYYRLSAFAIELPSLRDRMSDLHQLAEHFLQIASRNLNRPITKIDPQFLSGLRNYPFKGNLRELRNIIERAAILCEGDTITSDLLPANATSAATSEAEVMDLWSIEKNHILKVLRFTGGNRARAAEILGIGEATLYRKIREYNL